MTDISKKAIALAKENTTFASDRITALTGNLFEALHLNAPHTTHHAPRIFDIITANPPYGRPSDSHLFSREVVDHEPPSAVFGGVSGLDFIKRIIENGHTNLKPGGWMVFEIGIDQGEEIRKLVSSNNSYDLIEIDKDLAGIERIVGVRKKWKN